MRKNGGLQVGLAGTDHAQWGRSPDLLASLPRRLDGGGVDAVAFSAAGYGGSPAAVPIMEAVNRNARRPKKVSEEGLFVNTQEPFPCPLVRSVYGVY